MHAEPGAAADLLDRWRAVLGERAWVASRDEAVASGVFGPVDEALAPRIGDVVALARGTLGVHVPGARAGPQPARRLPRPLTATELAIPLLATRGAALA